MYLICNHKNKLTYNEVKEYSTQLKSINTRGLNFVVCPSYPFFYNFGGFTLGAQNVSFKNDDMTGEITAKQLRSLFVKYVIIAHPERKDSENVIIKKINNAKSEGMNVIYCLSDNYKDIDDATRLIEDNLSSIEYLLGDGDIIAYEPLWAIGNPSSVDYEYISNVIDIIRKNTKLDIIYGGGVDDTTVDNLLKLNKLDGFLVSNSSLNVVKLQNIIDKMTKFDTK